MASVNEFVFCAQESLAFMFEMAHLHEDALREYDELELCYLETGACLVSFFVTAVVKMMFLDWQYCALGLFYGTLQILCYTERSL